MEFGLSERRLAWGSQSNLVFGGVAEPDVGCRDGGSEVGPAREKVASG